MSGHRSPLLTLTTKPRLRGVLHLYGFAVGVVASVAFIAYAPAGVPRFAAAVFAVAATGMLGVSALLHRGNWTLGTTVRLLQLDHTMIFLTIAGTYTAVAVLGMSSGWATIVLALVWAGTIAGITFEWLPVDPPKGYVTAVYVTLGWVSVIVMPDLWINSGVDDFALVLAGGILYTGGAIVHAAARRPDPFPATFGYHEIFHACVLAALACHYAAVARLLADAVTTTEPVRFDPFAYEIHEDPYPVYRRLRDEAPAYLDAGHGFWVLSRDADVRAALNDPATFSSSGGITLERRAEAVEPMLIETDPPRHTRLRGLVSRAFTPKRVADLEGPVRLLSTELIDRFRSSGSVDVIDDFAARLPMAVIGEMLGVPRAEQDELRSWSDAMLHREPGDSQITRDGIHGATRLYEYFEQLITRRHDHAGTDLVSALLDAREGDADLSHGEILGFCFLLLIAGNETTTKLLGNAIFWLDAFPDQRAALLADPAQVPAAVEEVLRFDTSTQSLARLLVRAVTVHGVTLPAGSKGLLLFGSANRDERRWERADVLDISRNPAGHLAFGHGIHHCLGAALARLEGRIALEMLLPVLGEYVIDDGGLERVHSGNVRGFRRLPVTFA